MTLNLWKRVGTVLALMWAVFSLSGCDIFWVDGDDDVGIHAEGGFFYLIDNDSQRLVMLDRNLTERASWPFSDFTTETYVQGMTFDGTSLWVSISGGDDGLFELDLAAGENIEVVRSIEAPPSQQGAVRDIAWDGETFWALNSGSLTYGSPPELFQLDPVDGSVLASYTLPSNEPRGLCFVGPTSDVYGSEMISGCYYTDKDDDSIHIFETGRRVFHDGFLAPVGPRGVNYVYPLGIFFDGSDFWTTNSSGPADYLFRLDTKGVKQLRMEPPYEAMGALAWADVDLSVPAAPTPRQVTPSTGGPSAHKVVRVFGAGFREGLTVDFGAGVVVDSLTFVNSAEFTVYLTIAADAAANGIATLQDDATRQALIEGGYQFYTTPALLELGKMSADDIIDAGLAFVGTAESVARQLTDFHAEAGFNEFCIISAFGGLDTNLAQRTQERFASEVRPGFS